MLYQNVSHGNRSAVYLEVERYEDCLENINFAHENNFPDDKLPKLIEREEKCKKLMKSKKKDIDPWEISKLSYPANEKIPWLVDCLEVRWTKKFVICVAITA